MEKLPDTTDVLSSLGYDLPGNLVMGVASFLQFLEYNEKRTFSVMKAQDISEVYQMRANSAMSLVCQGDYRFAPCTA